MTLRIPLFSVTKDDLRIDTFHAGGKGGQNQNSRDTGVRVTHPPSGAVGECRETRHQAQNKKTAFIRMTQTPEFKNWLRAETARRLGDTARLEEFVDRMLAVRSDIRVEVRRPDGTWSELPSAS